LKNPLAPSPCRIRLLYQNDTRLSRVGVQIEMPASN
jgi:hypothetical protein